MRLRAADINCRMLEISPMTIASARNYFSRESQGF
jgi:hypothetical protein